MGGMWGGVQNLFKGLGRAGKTISKAAAVEKEGKAVGLMAGWKNAAAQHKATMEGLGKEGISALGKGGNVKKTAKALRTTASNEYGRRVTNAALIGGGVNAATGMVGGDEAGLLERFAYGAAIGGVGRAAMPGTMKIGSKQVGIRNVLMKSNKKLNKYVEKMMKGKSKGGAATNQPLLPGMDAEPLKV